jgi:uncharacterized protein
MNLVLLALVLLACLFLIPLGLPGLWVMVGAGLVYDILVKSEPIGWITIVATAGLALVAEVLEFTISGRYARKYGGSRRAEWGAILGGIAGAIVGVPVPIIGSVIGAFAGSFIGALIAEKSRGSESGAATRVATGALIGRVVAVAVKTGIGCAIAAWLLLAAWQ